MPDPTQPDPSQGNPALFQTPADLQIANTPNFINAAYSTPAQRAQLYAYSKALMEPQPVKNGWQGMAEVIRALTGGYTAHLADQYEAQSYAYNKSQGTPQPSGASTSADTPPPSTPPSSTPPTAASSSSPYGGLGAALMAFGGGSPGGGPPGGGPPAAAGAAAPSGDDYPDTQAGHDAFIRADAAAYAAKNGYDPKTAANLAASVAGAEGNNSVGWRSPNLASTVDIDPKTGKPFSFGDFQLNVRNGMGNEARAAGIDPADPAQWQNADHFAIKSMIDGGLGPWKGDRAVMSYQSQGGGNSLPRSGTSPAVAAMAHALVAGPGAQPQASGGATPPVQVAQNTTPYSSAQLGAMIANPNLPDRVRERAFELTQPQTMTDAVGNVIPVRQGSQAGPPVAHLGVLGAPASLPGGIPSQPVYSGTPDKPTVSTLTPAGTLNGANGWTPEAMDRLKSLAATGQGITAQGAVIADKAKSANDRFTATQDKQWQIQQAAQPLLQVKNVMDQHGGMLPTGEGADKLLSVTSAANMLSTLLGHPIQTDGSTQSGLELLRKYGTQVASSLAGNATDAGRTAAQHMSPSLDLSNATNEHLVDNYLRLNNLAKTRNDFERNYYLSHGGQSNPSVYDNFNQDWQNAITGKNAIPLSGEKYGRTIPVKEKDGSTGSRIVVPSTDTKGYSIYRPGEIPDVSTP